MVVDRLVLSCIKMKLLKGSEMKKDNIFLIIWQAEELLLIKTCTQKC